MRWGDDDDYDDDDDDDDDDAVMWCDVAMILYDDMYST